MIEVAVTSDRDWPDADWDTVANRATRAAIERTPHGALLICSAAVEISVRLSGDTEVRALNREYRGKNEATNVLSFAMIPPDQISTIDAKADAGEVLLGDIVLAHGICVAEAAERGISVVDHATHLIVHGTLHLLGYDHMTDDEAEAMESIERAVLADLGIADPYLVRED